jgi:hypothetical protein
MKEGLYVNVKNGREVKFNAVMLKHLANSMGDWLPMEAIDETPIPKEVKEIVATKIEYNEDKQDPLFTTSLRDLRDIGDMLTVEQLNLLLTDERKSVVAFAEKELQKRLVD